MTLSVCCQITFANKHKLAQKKKSLNRAVNWKRTSICDKGENKITEQAKPTGLCAVVIY